MPIILKTACSSFLDLLEFLKLSKFLELLELLDSIVLIVLLRFESSVILFFSIKSDVLQDLLLTLLFCKLL